MNARDRRQAIIELVRERGFVSIEALARRFSVASQTIRRDINALCAEDLLERYHGGAGLPSSVVNTDYAARRISRREEKNAIAAAIADYLPDNASVFVTVGTTMERVARAMARRKGLRVVTNNLHVATVLHAEPGFKVQVVSGRIRPHNAGIVGPLATDLIERYRADYAIVGCGAVEPDGMLMDFNDEEVRVVRAMMANARRVVLACDHSKFTRTAGVNLAPIGEISACFTDREPPRPIRALMRRHEVELHVCRPAPARGGPPGRGGDGGRDDSHEEGQGLGDAATAALGV